jgi:hypothetical protein
VVAPYPDESDDSADWVAASLVGLMIPAVLAAAAAAGGTGDAGDVGGKQ